MWSSVPMSRCRKFKHALQSAASELRGIGGESYDKGPLGKYLVEQLIAWNKAASAVNFPGIGSMELSIAHWETRLPLA